MKLNVNGEQLPLISSNDVIMNGSLDKTLTDVIDDHTEEINNLEKNIKWLYKYGGTGSKGGSGGGGSYAPEINLNCDIVFDGQVISNEKSTIILKNSDITTSNISLSLKKYNGLINYKVASITQVNNLRQSQAPKSICSATILNSDNNYSLSCVVPEIYDEGTITIKLNAQSTVTGEGDNKQYIITYIKNPYRIELNIANGNDEIIQGTDIYVDVVKGNKNVIISHVDEALKEGKKPQDIIDKELIPAINMVGELFDKKKYYLPQLIAGATVMDMAVSHLAPLLEHSKSKKSKYLLY